jgi:hypothetical protein
MKKSVKTGMMFGLYGLLFAGLGCFSAHLTTGMIGNFGVYNYSPSVIQSETVKEYWWCGYAENPAKSSQVSDSIQYLSIDMTTGDTKGPSTVLAETPGSWDSLYTCNPKVIEGAFDNPLGDGESFEYAMYYVGISDGPTNDIGVAFSKDGAHWKKYPQPVIRATSSAGYGVGQPALYNVDHKSAIRMFYEDSTPFTHHVAAISTDGVHFTVQGTLTTLGLDPNCPNPTWGDMAYDPTTGYWYAAFNLMLRAPSTTGGVTERGQFGVELYRIPDAALLTGSVPWQHLDTVDTNLTGFESNFIAAIVHDPYGNVNIGSYPAIQMYVSVSAPQPPWNASPAAAARSATPSNWDIALEQWSPNSSSMPFYRYFNNHVHEVTTGWVDPSGGFQQQSVLGYLYQSPQQGASVAFYGCKRESTDYFVSLDSACEGQRILGTNGYGYSQPVAGLNLVALYRCSTGHDHFVSQDPKCEGQVTDELLGYVVR